MRHSFKCYFVFLLVILLSVVVLPAVPATNPSSNLVVKMYGEKMYRGVIDRFILINGTNVTISGFTANLNNTWNSNSSEVKSFPAIWVKRVENDYVGDFLPVRDREKYDIFNSSKPQLIFASNYNGTHFSEAIIFGHAVGSQEPESEMVFHQVYPINDTFTQYFLGSYIITYEYNRTVFEANSTNSIYNPSYAILVAVKHLNALNCTFDNVTSVFLIPREHVLENFTDYDFVWSIEVHKDVSMNKTLRKVYHFVISPNGTILKFTNMTLTPIITTYPCGDCMPPQQSNSKYMIYVYLSVSVAVTLMLAISAIVFRKKRLKNNK